jgi:O-antigen/teichoic acid export membrane protein
MMESARPSYLSSALGGTRLSSTLIWIQAHFRTPLVRNGYSLIASTGMTSILGLVYWVLAARLYTVAEIGLNSALISTMMALGAIAQLNLGSVLTRFLPSIERSTAQRLILGAYAAGLLAALFSCALFLGGVHAWAPSLRSLAADPWLAVWFTAATMIWTVFSLQDGALAGLRKAVWVPVENTLFALAKIVLLVLLANTEWRTWGPFASWTLPLLVAVLPVNFLIFGRLLPPRDVAAALRQSAMDMRWVVRYFTADFLGTLFLMGAIGLAPILVVERVGAEGNAVYYLTWTIAYSLYLVSKSMGISLVAEGAADPWRSKALAAGALAHTMGLLVIAVAVIIVGAPLLLQLFGPSYAADGTTLLRVLCLSALPFGLTSMFLGLARVEGRMTAVVLVQGAMALLVLVLAVPLLDMFGTLGIGLAWLIAQVAIALALAAFAWRTVGWSRAAMQALGGKSWRGDFSPPLAPFRRLLLGRATSDLIREATGRIAGHPDAASWRCQGIIRTNGRVDVLALGSRPGQRTALIKIANNSEGIICLNRQGEVLRRLKAEPGLQEFRQLLPTVLAEGPTYVVEQLAVGIPGQIVLGDDRRRERALVSAGTVITELHGRTATSSTIDDAWLADWIDRPIGLIESAAWRVLPSERRHAAFGAIRRSQRAAWAGRTLPLGWSHGNFNPDNIRFSDDGARVTGIVDWSQARPNAPAVLDPCHLVLAARALVSGREIGDVVCDLLRQPCWSPDEQRCFGERSAAATESEIRALVLLTWLNCAVEDSAKSSEYIGSCLWTASQIEELLSSIPASL